MTVLPLRQTLCALAAALGTLVAPLGLSAQGAADAASAAASAATPAAPGSVVGAVSAAAPVAATPAAAVPAATPARTGYRPSFALQRYVWEYPLAGFSQSDYFKGVEALVRVYEQKSGNKIAPGKHRRVALKVYTASGPGMMTPPALTGALIELLKQRGFEPGQIVIVDLHEDKLREGGYLPRVGAAHTDPRFDGVQVLALDTGRLYERKWFYDSNLPSTEAIAAAGLSTRDLYDYQPGEDERKSFLNSLLLQGVDLWINLPMAMDSTALGVSGALANASLWNISNGRRFFDSPANAPVAAAEISAIPELRATWAFSILSLENYQYLGGPRFNAVYSERERRLWLSANPVALDYLMWLRFKPQRVRYGFPENPPEPPLFQYASMLGLGEYALDRLELQRLPEEVPAAAAAGAAADGR